MTIPHNDQAYIFERLALPEPPEVDPLAGYESVDPADVTPDGEPQDGVPRVCHGSVGANRADRASLGGGGHTDVACADACTAQDSCKFFVITSSGYCKMWFSCEPTQTKTQSGSVLYKKLQVLAYWTSSCDGYRLTLLTTATVSNGFSPRAL